MISENEKKVLNIVHVNRESICLSNNNVPSKDQIHCNILVN